ncbi:MAG: hypothetical protein JWM08_1735 [Candidatus Angelobacter sp.]|nr:hypothetical protein [Candidatus Angelobacter sp.]
MRSGVSRPCGVSRPAGLTIILFAFPDLTVGARLCRAFLTPAHEARAGDPGFGALRMTSVVPTGKAFVKISCRPTHKRMHHA